MQNDNTTLNVAAQDSTAKDKSVRRAALQNALGPAVEAALKTVAGLDLSKPEHQRRYVRALVRIAANDLLSRGVHPNDILASCVEGIGREVEALPEVALLPTPTDPLLLN